MEGRAAARRSDGGALSVPAHDDLDGELVETWRAHERLVDDGQSKAIGLSDVTLEKLREVVAAARINPAVVQVESHPYLPEWDLLDFCREHGIVLLAFAALGHGLNPRVVDDPVIGAVRLCVGIDFRAISRVTKLPDHAARSII